MHFEKSYNITKIVVIIVICYFLYVAVYQERRLLGCNQNPFDIITPCKENDNSYSCDIRSQRPQNPFTVFEKVVYWRRSFILAVIIIITYNTLIEAPFNAIKFLFGVITATFFIYFSLNFYKFHLYDFIYDEILKNYDIKLKTGLNIDQNCNNNPKSTNNNTKILIIGGISFLVIIIAFFYLTHKTKIL